jgi:hypothetical protein
MQNTKIKKKDRKKALIFVKKKKIKKRIGYLIKIIVNK